MPDRAPVSRHERHLEIAAALILGFTALATAWSGYQASLWGGIQSMNYTEASAARTEAAQARNEANAHRLADLSLFENYIDADLDGDDELAEFYRVRVRDDFEPAFAAWLALDPFDNETSPASPLEMEEYELPEDHRADDLDAHADDLFQLGQEANDHSDTYTLTTVLFAAALFFAAISERFDYVRVRLFLLAIAGLGFLGGVGVVVGLPVTTGG